MLTICILLSEVGPNLSFIHYTLDVVRVWYVTEGCVSWQRQEFPHSLNDCGQIRPSSTKKSNSLIEKYLELSKTSSLFVLSPVVPRVASRTVNLCATCSALRTVAFSWTSELNKLSRLKPRGPGWPNGSGNAGPMSREGAQAGVYLPFGRVPERVLTQDRLKLYVCYGPRALTVSSEVKASPPQAV